jgi:UDP-GlcNAc3NAcA epimerase
VRVATIVGARPQFIKMAPVSLALRARGDEEISIHTGQHYDANLSAVFFDPLGLKAPDHNLEAGSAGHGEQTARILSRLEPILERERPDWVLIIGDTNSTLAGALAAAKLHLPLGHIEAGLRSGNRRMPEEVNRICADHLSDRLYYSTRAARANLRREGLLDRGRALGDVTYDAVRLFSALEPGEDVERLLRIAGDGPFVLLTLHRAETTDDPDLLSRVWRRLNEMEWPVLFPIHPRTRAAAERCGLRTGEGLRLIDPVGYPTMCQLLRRSRLLITDSGGLQKEAYFFETPCLTLRRETEWTETVESGWNRLYDLETCPPIAAGEESRRQGRVIREYGDGRAAEKIVEDLVG